MPPRPRGKFQRGGGGGGGGMRGGYGGGWDRGHGGRGGGGGYRGRGRGGGHRGGRPDYYHGRRDSRSPPPRQHNDPEKILAGLGPEAQLALTTAIINSVLKTDGREGRGNYRERDRPHHRDARRDGRGGGGYFREESRERRHYGDERRSHDPRPYHEEGRGHRYEREKPTSGFPRYRNNRYSGMPKRRPSPHGHPGPSHKRQRVERMDSGESGSASHHERDFEGEEAYEQERDRERPRERRHRSPGSEEPRKGRDGDESKDDDDKEEGDGPSGVQITIRADGERAVNSEGHGRQRGSGRNFFVELRCPHCPSQKSVTFKEYKFHLGSEGHKNQLNRLARKHSVVLRKIRIQQRQEQREIEEKWKEEKPEDVKNAVSKFCSTCKLAFKCLGSNVSDGINLHGRSKLHRMQKHYLHPRCGMCHITFPSRMVYEYHIASINHLRVRTSTTDNDDGDHRSDDQDEEDDDDVLDLSNFMTLDSVGEDDEEEVGSEHEEITEGLEEVEAAEEVSIRKSTSKGTKRRKGQDDDEILVEADWDKENIEEDEEDEGNEAVGMEYVTRIEAYYCSLCCKVIRGDTDIGSRSVQRHCRTFDHLAHYQDAHPPTVEEEEEEEEEDDPSRVAGGEDKAEDEDASVQGNGEVDDEGEEEQGNLEVDEGEEGDEVEEGYEGEEEEEEMEGNEEVVASEGEGEGDESRGAEDDPEQEKFWEEVDEGLSALQGEIMNEIEDSKDHPSEKMNVDKLSEKDEKAEVEEESADEEAEVNMEDNDNEAQENEEEGETLDGSKEAAEVGDDNDDDNVESESAMEASTEEVGNDSDVE